MKAVNVAIRRGKTDEQRVAALIAIGLQEEEASLLLTPDSMGWIGYPPYKLSNNSGNIHRIKTRIASLEKLAGREAKEIKSKIYVYKENPDINRVMFFFDGKPALYIRDLLKSRGFKWSPRLGAWVRHLNNAGLYAVREVIAKLDLD
jgi:hypothetical protein